MLYKLKELRIFVLVVVVVFTSCSTKKNTWVSRNFHILTTHYNGWFYANEIINESVDKIQKANKDDYDKILPMYIYGSIDEAKTMTPDMEKAYKKISTCIGRHSMLIKDKQHNPWINDCFILVGKTNFYKHDYFAGLESFEYVANRNKKKPIRYPAMFWMLRTYNEMGLFSSAQGLIDLLADEKKMPKKYKKDFHALVADFYLKTGNLNAASKELTKAIALSKKSTEKTRFTYILAQVFQALEEDQLAYQFFSKVLKSGPSNEMAFQTKMNLATSFSAGNGKKDIKKVLNKMLKEAKYVDFKDQIYFALAKVHKKEGNNPEEIKCLIQSVALSSKNIKQKGISACRLGELYLDGSKYSLAEAYYDTAVTSLPKEYTGYTNIVLKKKSLSTLVGYLKTINNQDSLLKVANMSDFDRESYVEKMIEKLKEKELKDIEEAEKNQSKQEGIFTVTSTQDQNTASGASWYFYNPGTLSLGFTEFQKKWGTRKLEDNWRRSVKSSSSEEQTITKDSKDSALAKGETPTELVNGTPSQVKSKDFYLKQLPLSDSAKLSSKNKIIEAYYNMGLLYKEELNDNKHAAEAFENLIKKYPGNKYELTCYYQLYRIYLTADETDKSDKYKNILLDKYPNSEFSLLIKNPDYNKEREFKLNQAETFYQQTFFAFSESKFQDCIDRCVASDSLFPKSENKPKYALLKAMSSGSIGGKDKMIASLKEVVVNYPTHPVKKRAEELLAILLKQDGEVNNDSISKSPYTEAAEEEHFFVLLFPIDKDMNDQKARISDFNSMNFESAELSQSDLIFGKDHKMITVKSFAGKGDALRYYDFFKTNKNVTEGLKENTYQFFVISASNYIVFYKLQKPEDYKVFFESKYLKSKI
ncbi:MAG: tetratricopeptide repeat protein [Bacteroidota bacterium]